MQARLSRLIAALLGIGAILALSPSSTAGAQTSQRCFRETGYCISGRIRAFWEQNGGLPVFGYPITAQRQETIEGRSLQVQWFERNRLELHPENARPYDVQLGRLGIDRLNQQQRGWQTGAGVQQGDCRLFAETGHNVCGAILAAWRANGLELDGAPGKTADESLALFGLPLSDVGTETLSDGRQYKVQWFERARFEIHQGGVLFGLLGREFGPAPSAPQLAAAAAPVRIEIPDLGLSHPIVSVGLDQKQLPIVPDHDVGWYNLSAMPGQGENIVFWGHVLRFRHAPQIPAPFARLKELKLGAHIIVHDEAGAAHTYEVTQQVWATPNQVSYIMPQGSERVTLVSCIGDQVVQGGEVIDMSHRLITIAEPAR